MMKDYEELKQNAIEASKMLFADIKELHESDRDVAEKTGSEIMAVNALFNVLDTLKEVDAEQRPASISEH